MRFETKDRMSMDESFCSVEAELARQDISQDNFRLWVSAKFQPVEVPMRLTADGSEIYVTFGLHNCLLTVAPCDNARMVERTRWQKKVGEQNHSSDQNQSAESGGRFGFVGKLMGGIGPAEVGASAGAHRAHSKSSSQQSGMEMTPRPIYSVEQAPEPNSWHIRTIPGRGDFLEGNELLDETGDHPPLCEFDATDHTVTVQVTATISCRDIVPLTVEKRPQPNTVELRNNQEALAGALLARRIEQLGETGEAPQDRTKPFVLASTTLVRTVRERTDDA